MGPSPSALIAEHLRPGARVAVADGAGLPLSLGAPLAEAAASVGGISLLLGWCLAEAVPIESGLFTDVRTVMGGFALRQSIERGEVGYVPVRLSAMPSLMLGPLRPDVLLISWRRESDGWAWGSEVSWMKSLVDGGVTVLIEENAGLPATSREPLVPLDRGTVVSVVDRPPIDFDAGAVDETARAVARQVIPWVPPESALQYGPGPVGAALLAEITHPIHVRSGMVTDAVVDLSERGLLLGTPLAAYVAGTKRVYDWADGRGVTSRVETTHALPRVGEPSLVSLNSALEIDHVGQVNVQSAGGRQISGIGGHPDFAMLGSVSPHGVSVIALPTQRGGRATLVESLSGPVSTPRFDVDVVVTERGSADLRGRTDRERIELLESLWRG